MTSISAIRADIRTAYELIPPTDEHRATQYARAAHAAIIEASFDPRDRRRGPGPDVDDHRPDLTWTGPPLRRGAIRVQADAGSRGRTGNTHR